MKIYKTNEEVIKDIKDGVLAVEGDVKFECSISIEAKIIVNAGDINAWDINAWNINARNINARDINAGNINAGNINAGDINAWDINAWNINAWDINARDINAENILYYAFCCVYQGIKCLSIKAKKTSSQLPICLEGKLEIKDEEKIEEMTMEDVCKALGKTIKIKK